MLPFLLILLVEIVSIMEELIPSSIVLNLRMRNISKRTRSFFRRKRRKEIASQIPKKAVAVRRR